MLGARYSFLKRILALVKKEMVQDLKLLESETKRKKKLRIKMTAVKHFLGAETD